MEQNRKINLMVIPVQSAVLIAIMWLFVQDVSPSWSDADGVLAVALPAALLAFALLHLVCRVRIALSWSDVAVACAMAVGFFCSWLGCGIVMPSAFCRFMEMGCAYAMLRLLFSLRPVGSSYIVGGIVLLAVYEAVLGGGQLLWGGSRHILFPMTGNFLNPGPYSSILAVGASMVLGMLRLRAFPVRFTLLVQLVLLLLLAAVCLTASRAALLSVAVVVVWLYRDVLKRHWWTVPLAVGVACCLLALKSASAHSRLVIWSVSLRSFLEQPLLGHGLGSFPYAYASASVPYFAAHPSASMVADVCDNAFNEFVHLGVEQGGVGVLLMVLLLVSVGIRLHRHSLPLFCGYVSLLVFSLFSYPFQLLPYRLLLVLLCAYAASLPPANSSVRVGVLPTVAASLVLTVASVDLGREICQRKNAYAEYVQLSVMDAQYAVDDYCRLLPMLSDNPSFLFDYGKGLSALRRYNDSNRVLLLGTRCSADPMFYVCMGNNYAEMSLYHQAEQCYRHAHNVLPNRLYPLYKLMKLYDVTRRPRQCLRMARQVLSVRAKVASSAVREMKAEAQRICNEYERYED